MKLVRAPMNGVRSFGGKMRHSKLSLIKLLTFSCSLAFIGGCSGSFVTNSSAVGTLTVSSSSLDFGQVAVGKTATANITVVNQGSGAVQISQVNLSGQSFTMSGGSSLPMTVA